jgi:hypothetical protein
LQHTSKHFSSHELIKVPESLATEGAADENIVNPLHLISPIGYAHCDAQSAAGCLLVMAHYGHSMHNPYLNSSLLHVTFGI